ncbi:argininosuccinate lyase [Campylobacter sputorum subsp. bubulus]|uniref:Argininosuccinate lyase n=1 Tax=Campylobacter sputorum subsp. sputorum TaxID=32024 RepID=A0A381DKB4_9BACT|nr:argininosuccinate lyase [Campylobacter sputorum]ASM34480.1 argininosuccinate lyase [Campylobacter sputorum aubsp. sputorum RM3237]KAB0582133.1 argininosuccinate lyase [Campylobacter sputorum subsp. sputorum]QEL04671.1 argininosuccinate lyase [Campylobacter sputorum subsp. sputorum]SUX09510.1 argininosuccinate lyase [Campylobacter sputorum subsp. bubulus]SUX11143.1 argininosuccinate lyase [Campylobacter sputorum subsp. sputorum]
MQKMWSGRFSEASSKLLEEFNASINYDKNLFLQDINGSIAHATMLGKCGILDKNDSKKIVDGLNEVLKEIQNDKFVFKIEDEDIHMAVEKRLSEIIGADLGGRLHTARSRNDQVALDFRMFVLNEFKEILNLLLNLIKTLLKKVKEHKDTIMPGFTHLQHAQPVSFAYHLLAYCFMFKRDIYRLKDSFKRNNFSPLGCAALAGTPHKIDRFEVAKNLGFDGVTSNCMDSVSDRDFALELLFDISLIFTHTSRLCEELILWSSQEFMFISMSDKFSTGSSIMPQKKNPDVAELIRGKTGRVYGNLIALLTTMKSLPLAYNKDMQEDKEGVFDSVNTAKTSLIILNEMIDSMSINSENMLKACKTGHLVATDLADFLVRQKNIPFRKAHFITGKCVAIAESKGLDLSELSYEELRSVDENIDEDAMRVLNLNNSKEARNSVGGTANSSVENQIKELDEFLNS